MLSDSYKAKTPCLLLHNAVDTDQSFGGTCWLCLQSENGRDRFVQKMSKCLPKYMPFYITADIILYGLRGNILITYIS